MMKKRDLVLIGAAAGAVAGGLGWLVTYLLTAPREVASVEVGDPFPPVTGRLLSGRTLSLPGDLRGDVGVLIVTWDFTARDEVTQWAREVLEHYGVLPGIRVYQVAMVSGVGPILRRYINRAMRQGTPAPEHEHTLFIYGDLRALRRQLDTAMTAEPNASAFLIDRSGRLAWRADGPPTLMNLVSLRKALADHGVEGSVEA
ncbi:MAG: hypothetical protein ACYC6A_22175 [Armatimonadota bacterium]